MQWKKKKKYDALICQFKIILSQFKKNHNSLIYSIVPILAPELPLSQL